MYISLRFSNVSDIIMLQRNLVIVATIGVSIIFATLVQISHLTFAQGTPSALSSGSPVTGKTITDHQPVISDPNLKVETVFKGDKFPSSMAFLGANDILILQKNNGIVERIVNGTLRSKPLLHVNVATEQERGMLGVTVSSIKSKTNSTHPAATTYVFLYFTESGGGKTGDDVAASIKPKCNCVYRYELLNNQLVNPKLLLSLPATPGPQHNGGRMP